MDKAIRIISILVFAVCLAGFFAPHQKAQARTCDPFTTEANQGMLPLGTKVQFQHWEASGKVTRTGYVIAYYIQSCFPGGGGIIGLDAEAYVVDYGDPQSKIVLNFSQMGVLSGKQST